jgi:hypothetical protein
LNPDPNVNMFESDLHVRRCRRWSLDPSWNAEPVNDKLKTETCLASHPGGCMSEPNPLQALLRRNLGVDAFSLDGDSTEVLDSWADRPRKTKLELDPIHEN